MHYLKTRMATDWSETKSRVGEFVNKLLKRFAANPDYNLSGVCEWLIEFGDDNLPGREIGLDENGHVLFAGPNDRNYGFWLDANMDFADFEGDEITAEQFDKYWNNWQLSRNANRT